MKTATNPVSTQDAFKLFEPDTLDFWVANADSKSVASDARYTHYNLAELLKPQPAVTASRSAALPESNGK